MDFHFFIFFHFFSFFFHFFSYLTPSGDHFWLPCLFESSGHAVQGPSRPSRASPMQADWPAMAGLLAAEAPQPGTLKVHQSDIVALGPQDVPSLAFQRHVLAILRIWVSQPSSNQRAEGTFQQYRSPGHSKMTPVLRSKRTS